MLFQKDYPLAWIFHHNTCRWPFNMQEIPDTLDQKIVPPKEYLDLKSIHLPESQFLETSLNDAISNRLSCRNFTGGQIKFIHLATLLKSAYGIQGTIYFNDFEFLERPVPSGGGLYPLELYLIIKNIENTSPGIYHYSVLYNSLEQLRSLDLPKNFISDLFMGQPYLGKAAAIAIITAVPSRSLWKYGDRGYRYILLEAGHVAQNINLVSSVLGIGSLNLGGFFDSDLSNLLALDPEIEIPLYGIALGIPSSIDRTELRQPKE